MLLFDALSPGPRTVRMYLLEKNLVLQTREIDVFAGENRQHPFLGYNPAGQLPTLKLDSGICISESVAIVEYLEELQPDPVLIGSTPEERAITRQWLRRVEFNITEFIHNAYHYAEGIDRFKTRIPVAAEAASGLKAVAQDRIAWLDSMMGNGAFLVPDRFTVADIWLYVWLDFGTSVGQPFDRTLPNITPWFDRIAARPSATGSLHPKSQGVGVRG
ncbi:MAG TPA: glutathione S-transferase family protein [Gammaproteobacteria bacterium]|nr:glutathione S-transferase family protein [Gammaproteobacteria bacterium]